jgi:hypothetical protein
MITTILIVLVAVVVLIVIIAVLALHFLRADDSDNFDELDEMPADSRRASRSAPEPVRELVPAAADRRRSRPEPDREQRPAERPLRAVDDRPVRGVDDRQTGHRDRDTGPRPAMPERRNAQVAGQRPVAGGARTPKPAKVAAADAPTAAWDSMSDVDYWAELSADKPQVSPAPPAAGSSRPTGPARRDRAASPAARAAADGRVAQRGDSGPMPATAQPTGSQPPGQLPVRSRSHPPRLAPAVSSGRPAEAGQTEQLDVRAARAYGAEPATQSLAALARLSGQQSGPASRSAGGQRPGSGQRSAGGQRPAAVQRPAGDQRQAGNQRPMPDPRPARSRPGPGQRSGQSSLPSVPAAQAPQPTGYLRTPVPLDDDPLTSPSFPAINTSDSRSYRTRRPGAAQSGPHAGPQSISPYAHDAAPARPAAPVSPPSQPVANPYGSYVSAPQPVYQTPAQSQPDAASYGSGYPSSQPADGSWYGAAPTGYLPPGYTGGDYSSEGYVGGDHNGNGNGYADSGTNGAGGNGYAVDYPNAGYQGYQPSPVAPGGYGPQGQYPAQYDQGGYSAPDAAYGQDGYQGYPGYGTGTR